MIEIEAIARGVLREERAGLDAGQVAYTPDGRVACRGDFRGQAHGAFAAIKALVESQGGTMANVIKVTTYVTDMRYRADLAVVRAK